MNQKKLEKEITHEEAMKILEKQKKKHDKKIKAYIREELFGVEGVPEIQAIIKKSNQSLIKKILKEKVQLYDALGNLVWGVTLEDIKKIKKEL